MIRKSNLVYADISAYNGRARLHFGLERPDGSIKVRLSNGPTTKFSNIIMDINARLLRGRGFARLYASGWSYLPNLPLRRA